MTFTITPQGLTVLYKAINGSELHFTHAAIGNGNQQSLDQITDLANPLLTIPIEGIIVNDNNATLKATLNNSSVNAGFRMTEVGVFCEDPNNRSRSVLFAYASEPIESANWIAPANSQLQESELSFVVFVGNAENISAQINESLVYATHAELNDHINNTRNPHSVTKSQIGLGNVPNVTTNDQTPTFEVPTTIDSIRSGEKLGNLFGKISRAILDLISHVNSRNNPHGVTADQVNAASKSHTHSANDINAGILSVLRGGTGIPSLRKGLLLFAEENSKFGQIPQPTVPNAVLKQGTSGSPFFGALTPSEVGAAPTSHTHTPEQAGAAPAGHTHTAAQVGASPADHTHSSNGSYRGTGGSGSGSKNTIAYSKVPGLIFIAGRSGILGIILPMIDFGISFGENGLATKQLTVSHTDTSVSWYLPGTESHPANQLNANGTTYYYVIIT